MNWGHKITLVIAAFIVAMLTMVYVASRQTNEMIDKNYYERELKYQSLIDAANNLNAVSQDTLVHQNAAGISLQIPGVLLAGFSDGRVEFIRNEDESKDMSFDFLPDTNGLFLIDKSKFSPGLYKARIQWKSQEKRYYEEQEINIEG